MKEISKKKIVIIAVGLLYFLKGIYEWIQVMNPASGGLGWFDGRSYDCFIDKNLYISDVDRHTIYGDAKKTENKKMLRITIVVPVILTVLIAIVLLTDLVYFII